MLFLRYISFVLFHNIACWFNFCVRRYYIINNFRYFHETVNNWKVFCETFQLINFWFFIKNIFTARTHTHLEITSFEEATIFSFAFPSNEMSLKWIVYLLSLIHLSSNISLLYYVFIISRVDFSITTETFSSDDYKNNNIQHLRKITKCAVNWKEFFPKTFQLIGNCLCYKSLTNDKSSVINLTRSLSVKCWI